ncbi:MAG: hypothetical protein ACU84Q_05095 [Gammaproteobacteria bacterium]
MRRTARRTLNNPLLVKTTSILIFLGFAGIATADLCPDGAGPESAVTAYLQGMKDYQFESAYDFVTDNMTDGRSREDWSELQMEFIVGGEVVIGKLDVRDAHSAPGADTACASTAIVPNILRAKDKFNNQGSTEFELYTVVKQGDNWKIDMQETLFDDKTIKQWFPNDEIPKFQGQL